MRTFSRRFRPYKERAQTASQDFTARQMGLTSQQLPPNSSRSIEMWESEAYDREMSFLTELTEWQQHRPLRYRVWREGREQQSSQWAFETSQEFQRRGYDRTIAVDYIRDVMSMGGPQARRTELSVHRGRYQSAGRVQNAQWIAPVQSSGNAFGNWSGVRGAYGNPFTRGRTE